MSKDQESEGHQMYPRFTAAQLDKIRRFGTTEYWKAGDVMFRAGQSGSGMRVLIKGTARLTKRDGLGRSQLLVEVSEGQFLGETVQLTGTPALADGHAVTDIEALLIPPEGIRALLVAEAQLGEEIIQSFILRRVRLIQNGGGPVLIGPAQNLRLVALQGLLRRINHPHSVVDAVSDPNARAFLEALDTRKEDLPIVILSDGTVMRSPNERQLAAKLGLVPEFSTAHTYDIAVVGAGPAGLATAVYAASEGLSVIVFDEHGPGGQAGVSARIENYLGFPAGITGHELAARAFVQAVKFGAKIAIPVSIQALDCKRTPFELELTDGQRVSSHTVVIATGAAYRRPAIAGLDRINGCGVYYWASSIEAKLCAGDEVALVGGGNSAGQAIVFLSSYASRVHVLIRGNDLHKSMSSYLVERVTSLSNVEVHTMTTVASVEGNEDGLARIVCQTASGRKTLELRHLFLFAGADPNTGWLSTCRVEVDEKGFVKTRMDASVHADGPPSTLQTRVPGVFAIGDVRSSSAKRVAAAVGDGAAVVAEIHSYLAIRRACSKVGH
jgi:thioredoxin reductase (NADPH)